jgi:hypothetical protein
MAQRILVELALFLTPFLIFFIYRAASKDLSIREKWPMTTLLLTGGALAVAALVISPLLAPSDGGKCLQAQRYVNGELIPARMVDCDEVIEVVAPPPTGDPLPPPVAPRDYGG